MEYAHSFVGMMRFVMLRLKLGRRNIVKRLQQELQIEPSDSFQRRHFDVLAATLRPVPTNHFRFQEANNCFGERVIRRRRRRCRRKARPLPPLGGRRIRLV